MLLLKNSKIQKLLPIFIKESKFFYITLKTIVVSGTLGLQNLRTKDDFEEILFYDRDQLYHNVGAR